MAAQRPGTVTAAAIIMIVTGILIVLPAAFLAGSVLASGNLGLSAASNPAAGLAELALILALIPLAIGILEIVAGAKVLSGKAWARNTGFAFAVILGVVGLVLLSVGVGSGDLVSGAVSLAFLAPNAFITFALATGGQWFTVRLPTAPPDQSRHHLQGSQLAIPTYLLPVASGCSRPAGAASNRPE